MDFHRELYDRAGSAQWSFPAAATRRKALQGGVNGRPFVTATEGRNACGCRTASARRQRLMRIDGSVAQATRH
jgi:hypothetical protein